MYLLHGVGGESRVGVVGLRRTKGRGMTRKDYRVIAEVFAARLAENAPGTVTYDAIKVTAEQMSRMLSWTSGYTANGNKSFKPDVFLKACGL